MLPAIFLMTILFQTSVDNPNRFNDFLLLAYGVMWLVIMVYLLHLANKQRNVRQDIRLMRRLLEEDKVDRQA